ncbi:MAG: hypothetical protein IKO49_05700 [Bacilli bacterium]|nr:hypothetical protein [Bacilli bacterium]
MTNIDDIIKRIEKAETSDDSIIFYTSNNDNCRIIKILMDPFDTLLGMSTKPSDYNPYNKNMMKVFENIGTSTIDFKETVEYHQNMKRNFISTSEELDLYIHHLENILEVAYKNYYSDKTLPNKLYRSVTKSELDYLNKNRTIESLWSTTKTLDTSIDFTIEQAEAEWNPKEHFIIELSLKGRVPFVDVDNDAFKVFEPNEIILIPPFNVSKPQLIKKGGMDFLGFYSRNTIPLYKANFKSNELSIHNTPFEEIGNLYQNIRSDIEIYGPLIEDLLNYKIDKKLLNQEGYRLWAKNLVLLLNKLKDYLNYCSYKGLKPEKLINEEEAKKFYKKK